MNAAETKTLSEMLATAKQEAQLGVLLEIERHLEIGVIPLFHKFSCGQVGIRDIAVIVWAIVKADDKTAPDLPQVGEMILREGVSNFIIPCSKYLIQALAGRGGQTAG